MTQPTNETTTSDDTRTTVDARSATRDYLMRGLAPGGRFTGSNTYVHGVALNDLDKDELIRLVCWFRSSLDDQVNKHRHLFNTCHGTPPLNAELT